MDGGGEREGAAETLRIIIATRLLGCFQDVLLRPRWGMGDERDRNCRRISDLPSLLARLYHPPQSPLIPPDSFLLSGRSRLCSGVSQSRPLQETSLLTANTFLRVNQGLLCVRPFTYTQISRNLPQLCKVRNILLFLFFFFNFYFLLKYS